jgi:hypothetical protein
MSYVSDPGKFAVAVTKSDATTLLPTRALYIGVTGNLTVTMYGDGAIVEFLNVPVGIFPIQVTQVRAATTASSIVALR